VPEQRKVEPVVIGVEEDALSAIAALGDVVGQSGRTVRGGRGIGKD
jgi:hypothetical protein